jgi:hypothetical protein
MSVFEFRPDGALELVAGIDDVVGVGRRPTVVDKALTEPVDRGPDLPIEFDLEVDFDGYGSQVCRR